MQININKDDLLKALSVVQSIVEKRGTIEIFEHVKIDITDTHIYLTTTDSEIMITSSFAIKSNFTFSFTTIVTTLYEIIRRLYNSEEVTFITEEKNGGQLVIKSGRSKFILPSLPANEFPSFDTTFDTNMNGNNFKLSAASLKFLLNHTKHAICTGETKYYLNGIYIHVVNNKLNQNKNEASDIITNGENQENSEDVEKSGNIKNKDTENKNEDVVILRAVSTDSHRLATAEIYEKITVASDFEIIIPRKTVSELIKLIDTIDPSTEIKISANDHRIMFIINNIRLISKIIDAKFPDYAKIIKLNGDKILLVNSYDLKRSIELVLAISDGKNKELKFTITQDTLIINMSNMITNKSSGKQEIPCIFNHHEQIEILLNSKYVMECLNVIDGSEVEFILKDAFNPMIVKDKNDERCNYILMPMKLPDNI